VSAASRPLQPGDKVRARMCFRANGKPGGWEWRAYPATVLAVHPKTALIRRYYFSDDELVKLDRLTLFDQAVLA
jgi:hypothetical protein